jgi:hypothetical protein
MPRRSAGGPAHPPVKVYERASCARTSGTDCANIRWIAWPRTCGRDRVLRGGRPGILKLVERYGLEKFERHKVPVRHHRKTDEAEYGIFRTGLLRESKPIMTASFPDGLYHPGRITWRTSTSFDYSEPTPNHRMHERPYTHGFATILTFLQMSTRTFRTTTA